MIAAIIDWYNNWPGIPFDPAWMGANLMWGAQALSDWLDK